MHRHIEVGIWLLINCGTDGLRTDQVQGYGEPDPAQPSHSRDSSADSHEQSKWDAASCSDVNAPTEMSMNEACSVANGEEACSIRSQRDERTDLERIEAWGETRPPPSSCLRSGPPASKRSKRVDGVGMSEPCTKSHRRLRRRRQQQRMSIDMATTANCLWPKTSDAVGIDNTVGFCCSYVKGPPEPELELELEPEPELELERAQQAQQLHESQDLDLLAPWVEQEQSEQQLFTQLGTYSEHRMESMGANAQRRGPDISQFVSPFGRQQHAEGHMQYVQ
jgi:hypothetical protein